MGRTPSRSMSWSRNGMSYEAMKAFKRLRIRPRRRGGYAQELRTLQMLADYHNVEKRCAWPGTRRLSRDLDLEHDKGTLLRLLQWLSENRLIIEHPDPAHKQRKRYALPWVEIFHGRREPAVAGMADPAMLFDIAAGTLAWIDLKHPDREPVGLTTTGKPVGLSATSTGRVQSDQSE